MAFLLNAAPPCPKPTFTVIAFSECSEGFVSKFLLEKLAVEQTASLSKQSHLSASCSLLVPKDTRLILGYNCIHLPYLRNPRLTTD